MACSINNCEKEIYSFGWCRKHYTRWKRHGNPHFCHFKNPPEELFWHYVKRTQDCWIWTGCLNKSGYGVVGSSSRLHKKYKTVLVHRISYILSFGKIPEGLFICHRCDNPRCVNPEHLFAGTHYDNMQDMHRKGRAKYSPRKGTDNPLSKLSDDDVRTIRSSQQSYQKLAEKFSVGKSTIFRVKKFQSWKHVSF